MVNARAVTPVWNGAIKIVRCHGNGFFLYLLIFSLNFGFDKISGRKIDKIYIYFSVAEKFINEKKNHFIRSSLSIEAKNNLRFNKISNSMALISIRHNYIELFMDFRTVLQISRNDRDFFFCFVFHFISLVDVRTWTFQRQFTHRALTRRNSISALIFISIFFFVFFSSVLPSKFCLNSTKVFCLFFPLGHSKTFAQKIVIKIENCVETRGKVEHRKLTKSHSDIALDCFECGSLFTCSFDFVWRFFFVIASITRHSARSHYESLPHIIS